MRNIATTGNITMSRKEINSLPIFERLRKSEITQRVAALQLQLTERQVRNKLNRYLKFGAEGLAHRSRGRPSNKRIPNEKRNKIVQLIKDHYHDFGPTFAAEQLLKRNKVHINRETLRQIMISEGLWKSKKEKQKHRAWRARKEHYGEMYQLDGSPHQWIENRGGGPWWTLLSFVDDATSKIMWAEFTNGESTMNTMRATNSCIEKNGQPVSMYTDKGGVFKVNNHNPDNDKLTQYGRALKELGIKLIHANSPQAKGRVERSYKTLQDRLVKEMRLERISTMKEANKYLQEVFISDYNKRFSVSAKSDIDAHRNAKKTDLHNALCTKETRTIKNDFTIQYYNRIFQLTSDQKAVLCPKEKLVVAEHFTGEITLWIRRFKLNYVEIFKRSEPIKPVKELNVNYISQKPSANHPWRRRL